MVKGAWSTFAAFATALLLPLMLFIALQAAFSMRAERKQIEADALSRAREITAVVDGELLSGQSALQVLSASQYLKDHDWSAAKARVAAVQATRLGWRNVILTDVDGHRDIWETTPDPAQVSGVKPFVKRFIDQGGEQASISGIVGGPPACPCLALHAPVFEAGRLRYVLTLEMAPDFFQKTLTRLSPQTGVSAIVDRDGIFIARTVAFQDKVGKPATHYVRDAIKNAQSGFYPGVTYEGLKNYTAFETSAVSGWSTHVAVKSTRIGTRDLGAFVLTALAAGAALALAIAILAYAYWQMKVRKREELSNLQAQKLAVVGQLAAGIAHDFNNLLMAASGNVDMLRRRLEADHPGRRFVDNASAALMQGAKLTGQLLAFSRAQQLEIKPVDVGAALNAASDLVAARLGLGRDFW